MMSNSKTNKSVRGDLKNRKLHNQHPSIFVPHNYTNDREPDQVEIF